MNEINKRTIFLVEVTDGEWGEGGQVPTQWLVELLSTQLENYGMG